MVPHFVRQGLKQMPGLINDLYYSARGIRRRLRNYDGRFRRHLAELRASQWWPIERQREYQDARVREIVLHAWRTVPFYREWFGDHGVCIADIRGQADLAALPVLTKQIVREQQKRMVSLRYRGHRLRARGSSGTTGTAVVTMHAPQATSFHRALSWRQRERFGLRYNGSRKSLRFAHRVGLFRDRRSPPFWWWNWVNRQAYLSPAHLSPQYMPAIIEWMARQRFDLLSGWPSAMHAVASYMVEQGIRLRPRPRCVQCVAETLLPNVRACLMQAFGAPIAQHYDMTEMCGHMTTCERGRFHLDFECCCLHTRPVAAAAGIVHSLIFTGWGNPAMPYIHYEIGDYARPSAGPCPCGRESPSFDTIDGRTDDYVRTPDGRLAIGLNAHLPSAREVQIRQDRPDAIEVQVRPGTGYRPADEAEMIRRLREVIGHDMEIRIVQVDHIARSGNGKFRAVVSTLGRGPGAQAVRGSRWPS